MSQSPGLLLTLLAFALVIGPLVFLHELGHYLAGRLFGVKIDAFSIGFGSELFGWTDKHGTRWKVSALEYVPTVILRESAGRPVRVAPVSAALADPRLARGQQARLKAARANVVKVVTSLGAVREGAREGR